MNRAEILGAPQKNQVLPRSVVSSENSDLLDSGKSGTPKNLQKG
jgi:hypothetical protein